MKQTRATAAALSLRAIDIDSRKVNKKHSFDNNDQGRWTTEFFHGMGR
jgi:hypothetical protein